MSLDMIWYDASENCVECGCRDPPLSKSKRNKKTVEWIQCDKCDYWYHIDCLQTKINRRRKFACNRCVWFFSLGLYIFILRIFILCILKVYKNGCSLHRNELFKMCFWCILSIIIKCEKNISYVQYSAFFIPQTTHHSADLFRRYIPHNTRCKYSAFRNPHFTNTRC